MQANSHFNLTGLNALVCGASQGIGRATAELFAKQGARVVLLARQLDKLEAAKAGLTHPEKHICLAADLSRSEDIQKAVDAIATHVGTVHVLVNNAGGPASGPLLDAKPASFEAALTTHILSQLQLCQAFVPGMAAAGYGRIINIISTSVRMPIAGLGVSNTIRAAVAGFAKTMSNELAPRGITVNNVLPGYTRTERLLALAQAAATREGITQEAVLERWLKQVPMGRFAEPAEVAAALSFLASREAGYITGVSLQVDGGRIGAI
ncbi:MAG: SDR family oxidoreductase [Silvanigrellaceae bacterium]